MTVDHIGFILFPQEDIFRIIGRLSFPLFAFLIAYGCTKTRNLNKYFLRLISFAVWIQIGVGIINMSITGISVKTVNIFFTLAFGVLGIWMIEAMWKASVKNTRLNAADCTVFSVLSVLIAALVSITGGVLLVDYGAPGVALILMFYGMLKLKKHFTKQKQTVPADSASDTNKNLHKVLIFVTYQFILPFIVIGVYAGLFEIVYDMKWNIHWWGILSVIFIWMFIDRKIKIPWFEKYFFYIYYPLHFVILYLISILVF